MKENKRRSPVAKHMEQFNKPKTFRDRTKYTRKSKHKKGDSPFLMTV